MKKLQLSLFKEHFDKTKAGVKREDYRALNAYWATRLLKDFFNEIKPQKWWQKEFFDDGTMSEIAENLLLFSRIKYFDINRMTLGYPKSNDTDRILDLEHKGIEIREGNPDWGAEKGVLYFCILHGDILNNQE